MLLKMNYVNALNTIGQVSSTAELGEYGVPTLVVNADDGYEPKFEEIVAFVMEQAGNCAEEAVEEAT